MQTCVALDLDSVYGAVYLKTGYLILKCGIYKTGGDIIYYTGGDII